MLRTARINREPGVNPGRPRHCKRRVVSICHWGIALGRRKQGNDPRVRKPAPGKRTFSLRWGGEVRVKIIFIKLLTRFFPLEGRVFSFGF